MTWLQSLFARCLEGSSLYAFPVSQAVQGVMRTIESGVAHFKTVWKSRTMGTIENAGKKCYACKCCARHVVCLRPQLCVRHSDLHWTLIVLVATRCTEKWTLVEWRIVCDLRDASVESCRPVIGHLKKVCRMCRKRVEVKKKPIKRKCRFAKCKNFWRSYCNYHLFFYSHLYSHSCVYETITPLLW